MLNIVVCGSAASGKTELCKAMRRIGPLNDADNNDSKLQFKEQHVTTGGIEHHAAKLTQSDNTSCYFQIYELSGTVKDTNTYLKDASIIFFCCDLTRDSFPKLKENYRLVKKIIPKTSKIYIIGTKSDLAEDKSAISINTLSTFASKHKGCQFFQTSAKNSIGIEKLMHTAVLDFENSTQENKTTAQKKADKKAAHASESKARKTRQRKFEEPEQLLVSTDSSQIQDNNNGNEQPLLASATEETTEVPHDLSTESFTTPNSGDAVTVLETQENTQNQIKINDFPDQKKFSSQQSHYDFDPKNNPCVDYYNQAYIAAKDKYDRTLSPNLLVFAAKLNIVADSYECFADASASYIVQARKYDDKKQLTELEQTRNRIKETKKKLASDLMRLDRALLSIPQKVATIAVSFISAIGIAIGIGALTASSAGFISLASGPAAPAVTPTVALVAGSVGGAIGFATGFYAAHRAMSHFFHQRNHEKGLAALANAKTNSKIPTQEPEIKDSGIAVSEVIEVAQSTTNYKEPARVFAGELAGSMFRAKNACVKAEIENKNLNSQLSLWHRLMRNF